MCSRNDNHILQELQISKLGEEARKGLHSTYIDPSNCDFAVSYMFHFNLAEFEQCVGEVNGWKTWIKTWKRQGLLQTIGYN